MSLITKTLRDGTYEARGTPIGILEKTEGGGVVRWALNGEEITAERAAEIEATYPPVTYTVEHGDGDFRFDDPFAPSFTVTMREIPAGFTLLDVANAPNPYLAESRRLAARPIVVRRGRWLVFTRGTSVLTESGVSITLTQCGPWVRWYPRGGARRRRATVVGRRA